MKAYLAVFIGGALGGVTRAAVSGWLGSLWGVAVANLVGSFALALLLYGVPLRFRLPEALTLGVGTGFIGAFTTFSAVMLPTTSPWVVGLNLVGGFALAALGFAVGLVVGRRGARR